MEEQILINVTPRETRIALLEGGILQEIQIERACRKGRAGNIYKGKITRVLPGIQAAFVDIGLERTAFLHVSDLAVDADKQSLNIRDYVYEGQELLVQIIKDPIGSKGARLSTQITLSSRYLVFLPLSNHLGLSKRIENEAERERLTHLFSEVMRDSDGGFIVRTAAETVTNEKLLADISFLKTLWQVIQKRANELKAGNLLHADLPLAFRVLRDQVSLQLAKVIIDTEEFYREAVDFAKRFIPHLVDKIEYYQGDKGLFEQYNIEQEIDKALARKVPLKSGGYLIIDQTEAMTIIDVNTGGYVGRNNVAETLLKTNIEAAQIIARQLRLRNIGGIIIIDFIDMQNEQHREQLLQVLEAALTKDYTKTILCGISSLGLVQMTRKRTRENLAHILCETCPTCQGRGLIKTAETVCYEIFRELLRIAKQHDGKGYIILATQEVIDYIYEKEANSLANLEQHLEKEIKFQVETSYTQEQYDIIAI